MSFFPRAPADIGPYRKPGMQWSVFVQQCQAAKRKEKADGIVRKLNPTVVRPKKYQT